MTVWLESPFDSLPTEGFRKQRYWMMAEAFASAGHRVVYWTSDFSHAKKRRRVTGAGGDARFELVMLRTLPYAKNICLKRIRSHRAYAREWERQAMARVSGGAPRPDLIVVSVPPVATGDVAIRLARLYGARLVADMQDAWPETFYRLLPHGFRWMGGLLLRRMARSVRRLYRTADLVTGVCDRYRDLALSAGACDYYRAYLGIELPCGSCRQTTNDTSAPLRLAYVGNLGTSYDLATVVAGLRRLRARRPVTLDVAGFGGELPTAEGVRFHGLLGKADLQRLLESCDVGVIPMCADSYVGLPNKLGEYAAAGLRIVSSLSGETETLIGRYRCGATYATGDADAFAEAVERAALLPSAAAYELCARELSAEKIYREYVSRCEELVK